VEPQGVIGPYVHHIDPVLADLGGLYLWWYGLGFSLGFLQIHLFLKRHRASLGLSLREAWSLSLFIVIGVLAGGRLVEVTFDEWPFYRAHAWLIPAYWLGGMATHGLLIGAAAALGLFAALYTKPLRELADALVIPGAFLLGVGRLGNFIDGQIVGSVTDVWWAVKFPDTEGLRHPVVLYDGAKNMLLMLFLMRVRAANPTPGATAARFVFWYAFPRIFIDLFRDYPRHRLALGTGQTLNIVMAVLGAALLVRSRLRRLGRLKRGRTSVPPRVTTDRAPLASQRVALAALLAGCLTIPSNWTQDVPARYASRHPGLRHSWLYPAIDTGPPRPANTP
jgi:phosphatidylglycerol:prolipoprotein diacylglycerol transferase